jgi:hypothetical protein
MRTGRLGQLVSSIKLIDQQIILSFLRSIRFNGHICFQYFVVIGQTGNRRSEDREAEGSPRNKQQEHMF